MVISGTPKLMVEFKRRGSVDRSDTDLEVPEVPVRIALVA